MSARDFTSLMCAMLQHSGIPLPAGGAHEVYSLHFDGEPDIHVIGRAPCHAVEVVSEASRLLMPADSGKLLDLLELNRCDGARHPVSVAVDRHSGTILVWASRPLAALDVPAVMQLVQAVRLKSAMVRRKLALSETSASKPMTERHSRGTTLSSVLALQRRRQ